MSLKYLPAIALGLLLTAMVLHGNDFTAVPGWLSLMFGDLMTAALVSTFVLLQIPGPGHLSLNHWPIWIFLDLLLLILGLVILFLASGWMFLVGLLGLATVAITPAISNYINNHQRPCHVS